MITVLKFVKFTTKTPPSPTVMARKTGVLFSSRYKWSKDPEQDGTDSAQDTSATVNVKSSRKLDRRKEAGSRTSTTKEPSVLITANKATNLSHSNRQREFTACNKNYKNDSGKVFQKWSLKQRYIIILRKLKTWTIFSCLVQRPIFSVFRGSLFA